MVFLRISPWKGVLRFGKRGKLSSRYIGPYRIVERIGEVAYRLELPFDLDRIHDVFHVSMLRKYIPDRSHVLTEQLVEIHENLTYKEEPVQILDRREQVLRNKTIPLVKVMWRSHTVEEATWEHEEQMKRHYPLFFFCRYECFNFEDEIFIRRGDCKTPTLLNVIIVVFELI